MSGSNEVAQSSPAAMPPLQTERLRIRPYEMDDLERLYHILDVEVDEIPGESALKRREEYVRWSVANHQQLALLYQPPYGDRAVVRKVDNIVIGVCGLVPSLGPFGLLPSFSEVPDRARAYRFPEVGLFYALSTEVRGQGYATEAAQALIDFGFTTLELRSIIATTTYDNEASMAVMRRLGMRIERNPLPEPKWFQVVGVLDNPALESTT